MKIQFATLIAACLCATQIFGQEQPVLKTQKDKSSYSMGLEIGAGMRQQKLDVDPDLVVSGLRDGLSGKKGPLTKEEARKVMELFEKELEARMQKEAEELPEKNRVAGAAFLAENKNKDGVNVLPSGLQYKVVREGTGPIPKLDDKVSTHYRGMLIDGTEFDNSYDRGSPTSFGLRQVIKGWQEALQLMKVGSKWQLFVPSDLAYGDKGAGRKIAPNETLIFEIELLAIEKE